MMISRKMLRFGVKRWIRGEKNRGEVVTVELRSNRKWNTKLFENMTNPSDFRERHLYSASVELFDIVGCLRDDQEMRLRPRKVQYPPVDRLVSLHPSQSLSLYALKTLSVYLLKEIPIVTVPFTYLRILFKC